MEQDGNLGEMKKKERMTKLWLNFEFLEICIVLIYVNKANIYHSKRHLFFILCNNLYILKT